MSFKNTVLQDRKLLTSCSVTERVRLWDRYAGPIDQDAIKVEFFRKAHRRNPPFRFKVKLPPRNRVRVSICMGNGMGASSMVVVYEMTLISSDMACKITEAFLF
jgi:hypothetical protein